jgi:hypothetical protein
MTRMFVNTQIRLQKAIEARRSDAGQGSLEYIGMVVVAVIIVVAVIAAFDKFDFAKQVDDQLTELNKGLEGAGK